MMWYISNPHLGNSNNAKIKELHEYMQRYSRLLIKDEATRKAIINEIEKVVSQLNEKYPRTKPLAVQSMRGYNEYLTCAPSPRNSDSDAVFTLTFSPINQVWEAMSDGSFAVWKEKEK